MLSVNEAGKFSVDNLDRDGESGTVMRWLLRSMFYALWLFSGTSYATLTTIGAASYKGNDYRYRIFPSARLRANERRA